MVGAELFTSSALQTWALSATFSTPKKEGLGFRVPVRSIPIFQRLLIDKVLVALMVTVGFRYQL